MTRLLVASLAIASALKLEGTKPAVPKLLALRGGADVTTIAKYVAYGTSTFMFLPAGRDVVAPGAEVMPDDDKMMPKFFSDKTAEGYTFMWNQWGCEHF